MNIKLALFLILFFLPLSTFTQVNVLEKAVTDITQNANFSNALVAIAIYDPKTGAKIYGLNENFSIAPASTTKLFSTAAAITLLGDKQLETRFYIDGEIKDSVLYGNIWVRGGGDPTLGSKYTTSKTEDNRYFLRVWSDSIKAKGIKKITGAIIGDASEFGYKGCPDGWSWSDIGNAYGAYPSGLCIFDNVLTFRMKTGGLGAPVIVESITPEVPGLKFYNSITSADVAGDNSYIYGAPYQNDRIGVGTLQKSTMITVRGSLPDPEFQVAYEFKNTLQLAGIAVSDSVLCARNLLFDNKLENNRYDRFKLLFTYKGATIPQIVNWTNLHSVNMFAEQLSCLIGYYKNGDGSPDNGMTEEQKFWKRTIPTNGLFLTDGSGLSRSNGISVTHFCSLLNYMFKSANFNTFYSSLPITGQTGTLSNVCKNQPAHGKIHAKSGTMNRIKSYAGYVTTNTGRQLSFAIVINNYSCSNYQVKLHIQKFMNVLVTLP